MYVHRTGFTSCAFPPLHAYKGPTRVWVNLVYLPSWTSLPALMYLPSWTSLPALTLRLYTLLPVWPQHRRHGPALGYERKGGHARAGSAGSDRDHERPPQAMSSSSTLARRAWRCCRLAWAPGPPPPSILDVPKPPRLSGHPDTLRVPHPGSYYANL